MRKEHSGTFSMVMKTVVLLTLYQFTYSLACQSSNNSRGSLFGKGKKDHNLYRNPDYWSPSYWTSSAWNAWYTKWVAKQKALKKSDKKAVRNEFTDWDHTIKPQRWTRLPPGRDAQDPPPWAVIPQNHGKPHLCFQPPTRGSCRGTSKRWGFNPHMRSCQQFVYSGCGGNDNNFINKRRCEEACMRAPASNCLKYGRRSGTILVGKPSC